MAKMEPFEGTIEERWGKPLKDLPVKPGFTPVSSLNYTGESIVYETIAEIKAANDYPNDDRIITFVNASKKATAKQKAMTKAVADAGLIEPTSETDPQIGLKDMYRTLLTAKKPDGTRRHTYERARELAAENLGVDWSEASLKEILAQEQKAEAAAAAAAASVAEPVTVQ